MLLIFGGTTEGRMAVNVCEEAGQPFFYATKGERQDISLVHGIRHCGAMGTDALQQFCQERDIRCIVDAGHPFAVRLHQTIATCGLPVIRLQRVFPHPQTGITYCADYEEAIDRMEKADIRLLLALTGVNTIAALARYWQHRPTRFRILQREESRQKATEQGYPTERLLYYSPAHDLPTREEEIQLMKQVGCDAIITKESGESGGFLAKVQAAQELGIHVYVVRRPPLPSHWTYVTGPLGLRKAIEQTVPAFFPLKTGFTTGTCATAATKAALLSLMQLPVADGVQVTLPDGETVWVPIAVVCPGKATVIKDFSDDPDVTRGCRITAEVEWTVGEDIVFRRGTGVGLVTLPGLGIPVGEAAINTTPRQMMVHAIREVTPRGCIVTLSVENGEDLAQRTFNPRVGVVGGISIIGSSGIVRPLSNEAFIQSIGRELEVAHAIGCTSIGMASGKKGEEALLQDEPALRVIHYGNFVGETLRKAHQLGFHRVVLGIMIGKAVKLAAGHLDTHSHKVTANSDFLRQVAHECGTSATPPRGWDHPFMARELWDCMPPQFFAAIRSKCYQHCRNVFPDGELEIKIICDNTASSSCSS